MLAEVLDGGLVERAAGRDERVVVLLLEEELDEVPGERDVLRELPDSQRVDAGRRVDPARTTPGLLW